MTAADVKHATEKASLVELADARPPEFSDEALAQRFARLHGDGLRFVAAWSRWFSWTGTRWALDSTLAAFDRARAICRAVSSEADQKQVKTGLASAKTVAAVERLARADRCIAATVEQWDTHPWLLPTPEGEVNLRRGELGPAKSEHYITKTAPVAPGGECPLWQTFLARVTDGDTALQVYLARVAGYCLTAHTHEHALFFLHGTGANGKSVFTTTLIGILGDYAVTASMETFVESRGERHPTELALLRGARLVVATETEEGRRWNESRIKNLTGGDFVSARFMRGDFFTFKPTFKLMIVSNHKPRFRNVNEAIRRRLHLIPFAVTIPAVEQDLHLQEKLEAEWPGILAWAVEGCLEWRRIGLAPPSAVRAATDEYLAGEDSLALWLEECTETNEGTFLAFETSADLFANWKAWAERTGEFVGTQRHFSQALQARGFNPKRQGGTGSRGFEGIQLCRPDYGDDPRGGQ